MELGFVSTAPDPPPPHSSLLPSIYGSVSLPYLSYSPSLPSLEQSGDSLSTVPTAASTEDLHLDSWLVDFAQLFIQQTGLEPDK